MAAREENEFSPTDLAAAALSSCTLTVMAKAAELDNSDLKGSFIEIEKHMDENSMRIKKLQELFHCQRI